MKRVERSEVVDYVTYAGQRDGYRGRILAMKKPRRVHAGGSLTFLFENHDTVLYQIQEMMLAEKIVKEADILHEIETYNELIGGAGELGCVLLIEIDDPAERQVRLAKWLDLPASLYLKLADGRLSRPQFDPRQVGDTRLSSVQYLMFDTGGSAPIAIGADHPELTVEAPLSDEQKRALEEDLRS